MTHTVSSYVGDTWFTAEDEGAAILDPSTGHTVARVSATGLDVAALLDHARTVGGPALRALTFTSGLPCSAISASTCRRG